MEITSISKADSFKNFITVSLPGYIALWPFIYLVVNYAHIEFEDYYILISIIATILAAGIGIVIEDLGSHLENSIAESWIGVKRETLYYYWRRYLLANIDSKKPDLIMINYIGTVVIRLKVEIGIFISIIIMLLGQVWIEFTCFHLFDRTCYFFLYTFGFCLILVYLSFEFKDTIKKLHGNRKRFIDHMDFPEDHKVMGDDFVNSNAPN